MASFLSASGIDSNAVDTDTITISAFALTGDNRHTDVSMASRFSGKRLSTLTRGTDTYAQKAVNGTPGSGPTLEIWSSTNEPQAASATLVGVINSSTATWSLIRSSASDVDQTTRLRATPALNADVTGPSITPQTITSAVNELCVDAVMAIAQTITGVSEGGQTLRHQETIGAVSLDHAMSTHAGASSVDMGWNGTGTAGVMNHYAWSLLNAASGNPPVLTVPGTQNGILGETKAVTGISVADTDTDVDTIEATCTAGMIMTFDVTGTSVTPTGNGTASVTLEGTQADLNTVLDTLEVDRPESYPTVEYFDSVTIRAIDANDNEDVENIQVYWVPSGAVFLIGTPTEIITDLQALELTHDQVESVNVRMVSETSNTLSDIDDFLIDVDAVPVAPVLTVPGSQVAVYNVVKAISGISVAHDEMDTVSLLLECHASMALTVAAGGTGATITGNGTNTVLIEDTHADLNTVVDTLEAYRATAGTPLPSGLVPASANSYVVQTNLQVGNEVYTDRTYTFTVIPAALRGAAWIKTPNDDKASSDAATLTFTLNVPAWVYVTLDERSIETVPIAAWLDDWEVTNDLIETTSLSIDVTHLIFRRSFPAGPVALGGYGFGLLYSQYIVIVRAIENTLPIQVTAVDSDGDQDVASFDVAWGSNNAPVITSNGGGPTAAVNVEEGETFVTTVVATDADLDAITYSIVGGADALQFTVHNIAGVLRFAGLPDFENPSDADLDNDYVVIVQASDGVLTDTQTITVTVTNAAPTAVASSSGEVGILDVPTQLVGTGSSDPGGGTLTYAWTWVSRPEGSTADFSNAAIANPTFTPDLNGLYIAQLIVNDGLLDSDPDTIEIDADSTISYAYHDTIPLGSVISSDPPAGTPLAPGQLVYLVISLGPLLKPIPSLAELTQAQAESAITRAQMTVGTVTTAYHATISIGKVISQSPLAGVKVEAATTVDFVVSLGPETVQVPWTLEYPGDDADDALEQVGL